MVLSFHQLASRAVGILSEHFSAAAPAPIHLQAPIVFLTVGFPFPVLAAHSAHVVVAAYPALPSLFGSTQCLLHGVSS